MNCRLSFFCFLALPLATDGATGGVEKTLASARAYVGGEDNLRAVQAIRYQGTFQEGEGGATAALDIYLKKPLKQRLVLKRKDGLVMTQAISGYVGWRRTEKEGERDSWEMNIMKADELKKMRANTQENLNFYHGVERLKGEIIDGGVVEYGGTSAHLLEFRYGRGIFYKRYFDSATGRLLATEAGDGTVITEEGEQVVAGIRFPRKLITKKDGRVFSVVTFETVEVNPEVDDAVFELPSLIPGKRN